MEGGWFGCALSTHCWVAEWAPIHAMTGWAPFGLGAWALVCSTVACRVGCQCSVEGLCPCARHAPLCTRTCTIHYACLLIDWNNSALEPSSVTGHVVLHGRGVQRGSQVHGPWHGLVLGLPRPSPHCAVWRVAMVFMHEWRRGPLYFDTLRLPLILAGHVGWWVSWPMPRDLHSVTSLLMRSLTPPCAERQSYPQHVLKQRSACQRQCRRQCVPAR